MKVVQLSTTDGAGGAGRAARRLHDALGRADVESRLLAGRVDFPGPGVMHVARAAAGRAGAAVLAPERLAPKLTGLTGQIALPLPSSHLLARSRAVRTADVVHAHNLHGNWFDLRALPTIGRRRPLVWSLHDMWAATGHCAFSYDCERWRSGCGNCPLFEPERRPLDEIPQPPWDNSAAGWRLKRRLYAELPRLAVVTPSRWLFDLARESMLATAPGASFHRIPYGLDTDVFRPVPAEEARAALGLDPTRPVVFFGAAALDQERKGLGHLAEALRTGPLAGRDVTMLTVGSPRGLAGELPGLISLGLVFDERRQALAYSAADVVVLPSLADNQPLVALEALACGRPLVASAVGGLSELVADGETGVGVPPGDAEELSAAIGALLDAPELRARLGDGARRRAVDRHGLDAYARAYADLYAEVAGKLEPMDGEPR